ncbi:MAG TPA: Xaa-Pro peptidase family protein [Methylomirabilota bacterium]|jgi:Xaa-Pro aminopeptidase|nr:Xaa-Pro peptidase family protein [Methylomirabilota bacterium]
MADPAILIIAASEHDSNLYWVSGFLAPDPFVFLQVGERKLLLMSDLELDRAKAESRVDEVLAYSAYEAKARQRVAQPTLIDTLAEVLEEYGVTDVLVPASFGVEHADRLRERGIRLAWKRDPFFEERVVKRPDEVAAIEATQRATERAVGRALDALRQSDIRGDRLYWRDKVLTAETLRWVMHFSMMEDECLGQHTIVAPGVQGVDPHNEGSGPILPHQSLVLDVFPRSTRTRYWADMTRTVVRGRASDPLKRMYDAVLAAQLRGIELCADGVDGQEVHREVTAVLERAGFETGMVDGRMQGFFHGTGHGVGLDIHEAPRVSKVANTLRTGHVVTVEPGLYYPRWGAVRIEDMVLIQPGGCRNLTDFPKVLEI